jgi:hypothetical protein
MGGALLRLGPGYCAEVVVWCGPSFYAPGRLSLLLSTLLLRLSTIVTIVTVRDGADFKNKLMGVMVYF